MIINNILDHLLRNFTFMKGETKLLIRIIKNIYLAPHFQKVDYNKKYIHLDPPYQNGRRGVRG